MKRKWIVFLAGLTLAVGLAACSDKGTTETSEGTETVESTASQVQTGEVPDGDTQGQSGEGDVQADPSSAHLLYGGYDLGKYFLVDENGNKLQEINWAEHRENLEKNGSEIAYLAPSLLEDGVFYLQQYSYLDSYYGYRVYAVDAKTDEVTSVWTCDDGWYLDAMDYYNGKLYITTSGNGYHRKEYIFSKAENEFRVEYEKNAAEDFLRALDGRDIYMSRYTQEGDRWNCSYTRALEEIGFVIGRENERYYRYFPDGSVKEVRGMPKEYVYIEAYDDTYVIYSKYDSEEYVNYLYCLDMSSGQESMIGEKGEVLNFLALSDGKMYLSRSNGGFVIEKNEVLTYNPSEKTLTKLYEVEAIPGATTVTPGIMWFQAFGGNLFFAKAEGQEVRWVKVNPDVQPVSFQDINCKIQDLSVFQYGKVIYDTYTEECPFCGTVLEKYYGEAFQLDAKYSAQYEKINQKLAETINDLAGSSEGDDAYTPTDEFCEDHREYPEQWCESVEKYVGNVRILNEKYLLVDTNSYWYGGGAHGYPGVGQYVFDLTTGEEKTLPDFYTGSVEDFKKLVAEKTKEDFLSYDEGMSPYYGDDEEIVYNQAYEEADPERSLVIFEEDGVNITYMPYDMGPYASGFIEVFISYQELLGRPKL